MRPRNVLTQTNNMRRLIYDMYYAEEISMDIAARLLDKLEQISLKTKQAALNRTACFYFVQNEVLSIILVGILFSCPDIISLQNIIFLCQSQDLLHNLSQHNV